MIRTVLDGIAYGVSFQFLGRFIYSLFVDAATAQTGKIITDLDHQTGLPDSETRHLNRQLSYAYNGAWFLIAPTKLGTI